MDTKLLQELGQFVTKINELLRNDEPLYLQPCLKQIMNLLVKDSIEVLLSTIKKICPLLMIIYPDLYKRGIEIGIHTDFEKFIKFLKDENHISDANGTAAKYISELLPVMNDIITDMNSGKTFEEVFPKLDKFLISLEEKLSNIDSNIRIEWANTEPKAGDKRKRPDDEDSGDGELNPLKKIFRERDR